MVESGNLLFETDAVPPAELAAARIGAEGIVAAVRQMGVRFAGIGSRDLAGGIALLGKLHRPPDFHWLSLNLVDPATGRPLFTPLVHHQAGGLRLAVLAVTDHARPPAGGALLPWRQVLPRAVARVAGRGDFALLLSNYSDAENREIARACPGIDLILQSGHVAGNMRPIIFDRTLLAQTDTRGRHLGVLDLTWREHGPWRGPRPDRPACPGRSRPPSPTGSSPSPRPCPMIRPWRPWSARPKPGCAARRDNVPQGPQQKRPSPRGRPLSCGGKRFRLSSRTPSAGWARSASCGSSCRRSTWSCPAAFCRRRSRSGPGRRREPSGRCLP